MTKDEFIIWLHGFFKISNPKTINEEQTALIKKEVEKFFNKATPDRTDNPDKKDFDDLWDHLKKGKENYPSVPYIPVPGPPSQPGPWTVPSPPPNTPWWETTPVTCQSTIRSTSYLTGKL